MDELLGQWVRWRQHLVAKILRGPDLSDGAPRRATWKTPACDARAARGREAHLGPLHKCRDGAKRTGGCGFTRGMPVPILDENASWYKAGHAFRTACVNDMHPTLRVATLDDAREARVWNRQHEDTGTDETTKQNA